MPPSESKTKIRPQQSCLKCRERKVKVRFPAAADLPSAEKSEPSAEFQVPTVTDEVFSIV